MRGTKCVLIEPTGQAALYLRRYSIRRDNGEQDKCPGPFGYHNANSAQIEILDDPGGYRLHAILPNIPKVDPRWPQKCDWCDYRFVADDPYQKHTEPLYKAEDGTVYPLREAPPGSMYHADWMEGARVGPDGKHLVVILPNGLAWHIDGPSASGGPGWTRAGKPPEITAHPSILADDYHGFLQQGYLTPDLDGHTYDWRRRKGLK